MSKGEPMPSIAETHWHDEWVKGLKRIAELEERVRTIQRLNKEGGNDTKIAAETVLALNP